MISRGDQGLIIRCQGKRLLCLRDLVGNPCRDCRRKLIDGHHVIAAARPSGTTCKAALDLGRRSVGIDISETFLGLAAARIWG